MSFHVSMLMDFFRPTWLVLLSSHIFFNLQSGCWRPYRGLLDSSMIVMWELSCWHPYVQRTRTSLLSDRAIFGTLPSWEGLLEIPKEDLWVINAKELQKVPASWLFLNSVYVWKVVSFRVLFGIHYQSPHRHVLFSSPSDINWHIFINSYVLIRTCKLPVQTFQAFNSNLFFYVN